MSTQTIPRGGVGTKKVVSHGDAVRKAVSQGEIIRKNIDALGEMQRREESRRTLTDRAADAITNFSGSMTFLYIHVAWFGLWILLNVGVLAFPGLRVFDRFPFGLLTMIVSLEAIFLSTFVLISQNRMARLGEKRAELDLHVNMLAEQKAAKTLEMLDQLTRQLDQMGRRFNFTPDPEVAALKVSPEPRELLRVMEEATEETPDVKQAVGEAVEGITEEVEHVSGELREVSGELREVSGELREVRGEVGTVGEQVERVAADVADVKQELREITGEHEEAVAAK
jgi:uncharacterized membrane protein